MVRTVAVAISDRLSVSAHINYYLRIANGVARNFIEAVSKTLEALCAKLETARSANLFYLLFILFIIYLFFYLSLSALTHTHRRRNHGGYSGWRPHEIFTGGCALIRFRFK